MKRFILTGTPGAGKTTLLHHLRERGYATVEEAATSVIEREHARGRTEPFTDEEQSFVLDQIVILQRTRQTAPPPPAAAVQFFDRSPICTHALCTFLGHRPSELLRRELERIADEAVYQPQVFFVGNLGFCHPTAVRRISYPDSLVFEQVHRDSYQAFGYQIIDIPAAPTPERADSVIGFLARSGVAVRPSVV